MVKPGSFKKTKSLNSVGSGRSMSMATRSPGFGAKTVVNRRVRLNGANFCLSMLCLYDYATTNQIRMNLLIMQPADCIFDLSTRTGYFTRAISQLTGQNN